MKDYLHFYIGCEAEFTSLAESKWIGVITIYNLLSLSDGRLKGITPILRPLSDMTEEEEREFDTELWTFHYSFNAKHFTPEQTLWLLSKGFDLFGLIEAGLAIKLKYK